MAQLTLWGLNRVAGWPALDLARALANQGFFSRSHDVVLGDRTRFNAPPDASDTRLNKNTSPSFGLQCEDDRYNEYFVPLVVKCVGDPARFEREFGAQMGTGGTDRFKALLAAYPEHFNVPSTDVGHWASYWTTHGTGDGMRMNTHPDTKIGLYEIVARTKAPGGAVLVGYSQGGLVARFLAWMDENLFPRAARSIKGVVTVQSPNSGSPVADPENADNVARGAFAAVSGLTGFPVAPSEPAASRYLRLDGAITRLTQGTLGDQPDFRHFDVDAVAHHVDAAIDDARTMLEAAQLAKAREIEALKAARLGFLVTMRKWMTGLRAHPVPTAFKDLNTLELDRVGRILHLLHHDDGAPNGMGLKETFQGAVIGTDNQLLDFVRDGLPLIGKTAVGLFGGMIGLPMRLKLAEQAYAHVSLNEAIDSNAQLTPQVQLLASHYLTGVTVLGTKHEPVGLPALAHDFVIPSVSQAIGPRGSLAPLSKERAAYFLGNLINKRGTHISGAEHRSGESGLPFAEQLLTAMGKAIAKAA